MKNTHFALISFQLFKIIHIYVKLFDICLFNESLFNSMAWHGMEGGMSTLEFFSSCGYHLFFCSLCLYT